MSDLERIPTEEASQIETIVKLTIAQLKQRYPGTDTVGRGVHVKDHGCVTATFKVIDDLAADLRVGVFAQPGREYEAYVRFSNAAVRNTEDSKVEKGTTLHGSRGMAVKLLGVTGTPLLPTFGPMTQDFLMINQPVFAFSNVEDYAALSDILLKDDDKANRFFAERVRKKDGKPNLDDPITKRAVGSFTIVQCVQSDSVPPAYQTPPASPVDNRYFSGSPFQFGDDRVMKFSATPVNPSYGDKPNVPDRDYLRKALHKRLTAPGAQDIVFDFQVQVRKASDVAGSIDTDIEDACFEWKEPTHAFVKVATLTIPPQDFETEKQREVCERLIFTPWHGVIEHRPLGGINRLRRAVYEASAQMRLMPKEPAHL